MAVKTLIAAQVLHLLGTTEGLDHDLTGPEADVGGECVRAVEKPVPHGHQMDVAVGTEAGDVHRSAPSEERRHLGGVHLDHLAA